jgi:hypothetical protein
MQNSGKQISTKEGNISVYNVSEKHQEDTLLFRATSATRALALFCRGFSSPSSSLLTMPYLSSPAGFSAFASCHRIPRKFAIWESKVSNRKCSYLPWCFHILFFSFFAPGFLLFAFETRRGLLFALLFFLDMITALLAVSFQLSAVSVHKLKADLRIRGDDG